MSVITTTDMSDSDVPSRRRSHPLRRRLAIAAVVAVVFIVLGVNLARLYVDWLWFGEVGLRAIFWKRFAIGVVAGPVFAAAFFAVVYGNLEIARRLAPRYRPVEGIEVSQRGPARRQTTPGRWARTPSAVRAAEQVSRLSAFPVGEGAAIHISALAAALFVLGGLGYLFQAWNLLYSSSGVVSGAGYTDVHLRLPMIRVMMVLAFALGGVLVYNAARRRRPWWPAAAFGIWLASLIVLLGIVPAVWQALIVNPNQLAKETPYIEYNIAATRAAYDLTRISQTPYSLQGDLSAASLKANSVTVDNIRLWDPQVLLRSYSQLQELRPYYSFTTVSVDRYSVNGVYTQTMLAPRELRVAGLPPQAQTWVNQHITYTHGYGVAVSAVNQVSSGGSPDFLVQNVPTVSSAPTLAITQPQIYYGLLGTNYALVRTKYPTFDYPGPNG